MDRFPFPTKLISKCWIPYEKSSHDKFIFIIEYYYCSFDFEKGSQVIKIQSGIKRK